MVIGHQPPLEGPQKPGRETLSFNGPMYTLTFVGPRVLPPVGFPEASLALALGVGVRETGSLRQLGCRSLSLRKVWQAVPPE